MKTSLLLAPILLLPLMSTAAPGAHGPNGEHLDAPAQVATVGSRPRVEAATESFELVALLDRGELSIRIDRFASNEPVLKANLTVESGGIKVTARFREDQGDYVADDPKLLQLLKKSGAHPLVFTLIAGEESDLIDAVLRVGNTVQGQGHGHGHGHGHSLEYSAYAAGGLLILAAGAWLWRRRVTLKKEAV